mmetsp:Transcript_76888/g.193401  ORF Transcript_76888/g.193401 Transcript_76888/m.193401 type:complete len:139 (-) Transcript_76888:175-591(-)
MSSRRSSSAALRLAALACVALALARFTGSAFAPAPGGSRLRAQQDSATLASTGLGLAGALAAVPPQPAAAAELTYDGFGPPELVAIFGPIVFVALLYLEWEGQQESVDDMNGIAALGKTIDGPAGSATSYKRRSPEYD